MSRQFEGRRAFQTVARATALVMLLCVAAAGCAVKSRPVISPAKMAEFWQEPTDIGLRDLMYGAGGATLAPNPHDRYTVLKIDNAGFSPGYDVEDERGQKWSVLAYVLLHDGPDADGLALPRARAEQWLNAAHAANSEAPSLPGRYTVSAR